MRNLKKFLALVLAMMMVSACAFSVSAAYTDQAEVNATGYAEAVGILSDLEVLKGTGDGKFNPNGTLTRAEAAVIAAKLNTGAAGRKIDWTSATCSFADVDAAWSFAYINYASQHGLMDGVGGGMFNPNGTLTIAEAIVIAVKTAGLRAQVAELDKVSTPSYWATNWIAVANNNGLTENITVFDYSANCTRAMMAQVAYNIFNRVDRIADAFQMTKVTEKVAAVSASVVTLGNGAVVDRAAFENAMAATGAGNNAEAVKGAYVTMTYANDNGVVYGVSVNSNVLNFSYKDAKLANVKDGNNLTAYVTLDGTKYIVADTDLNNNDVIGSSSVVKAISLNVVGMDGKEVKMDATKYAIPAYYTASAFDDDNDGFYDRVNVSEYALGTLSANTTDAKEISGVKYQFDSIKNIDGSVAFTNFNADDAKVFAINYTGAAFAYGEAPVLYNVTFNAGTKVWTVDVLEVAATVSGKLTAISNANKTITIDGTKYAFQSAFVAPETWTLNQNVSIYTVDGKYVKFTSSSKAESTVIVNNVVVKDGAAVITGYNAANFAEVEITVIGALENGKMMPKVAHEIENKVNDKVYAGEIALGTQDANKNWTDVVKFVEGGYYTFNTTASGTYFVADAGKNLNSFVGEAAVGSLEVKNGYVYIDGVATMYTNNVVILEPVAGNENKYSQAYNKYTTYNKRANVSAYYEKDGDGKVTFMYITNSDNLPSALNALPAGQTIVQIIDANAVEAGFDYYTYKAVDLFTGKVVEVKFGSAVTAGHFYTAADNSLIADTTGLWVKDVAVTVEEKGLIATVKAPVTYLEKLGDVVTSKSGDAKEFGIDNVVIFTAGADKVIDVKDGAGVTEKYADVLKAGHGTVTYTAYCVAGQLIIVK